MLSKYRSFLPQILPCGQWSTYSPCPQLNLSARSRPDLTWVPPPHPANLFKEASWGNRNASLTSFPPLRGHCLSLLAVQCLENNSPCTLSVFVCWFISGGKVNLVLLSCLEAEDMLAQVLFNHIHEP